MTSYRPEVDGLRAISVLSVIFFHAHFPGFSGGFVGVDIFYVISGFLITGIIARETDQGQFTLKRFYERRVRRILPALMAVLVASAPAAWMLMLPHELAAYGRSLVAAITFLANISFAGEANYFGTAAALKPLIHTWSLSLEEQFYICFPFLFIVLKSFNRKIQVSLIFILLLLSLLLAEFYSIHDPVSSFYYLHTRAWELLFGGLLALSAHRFPAERSAVAECFSVIGLSFIICSIVMFDESTRMPGFMGLIPLGGAAMIIAFARPTTFVGKLLSSRAAVFIGMLSYSAYLWHQPIFAFSRMKFYWGVSPLMAVSLCILTFALAWLTWRYVETPARDSGRVATRPLLWVLGCASAIFLLFGLQLNAQHGFPNRVPAKAVSIESDARRSMLQLWSCETSEERPFDPERICSTPGNRGIIAIWGDSHAMALSVGLGPALSPYGYGTKNYSSSSCVPVLGAYWVPAIRKCEEERQKILQSIINDPSVKTVVLAARWPRLVESEDFDNGEGGVEFAPKLTAKFGKPDSSTPIPAEAAVSATLAALTQGGKNVVLVHAIPEVGWDVPATQARRLMSGESPHRLISTGIEVFRERTRRSTRMLQSASMGLPTVLQFDPATVLCDTIIPRRCAAETTEGALYFDDDHLNVEGSRRVANALVRKIASRGWLSEPAALRRSDAQ